MNDVDRSLSYLPHLRSIEAFAALDEQAARYLAGGSQVRTVERGQIICEKGSLSTGLQCLLAGRIKLSVISALGTERVLDILMPGRVFGLAAVLLDEPCPVFAESISDCRMLVISRERIQTAIAEWPQVGAILLKLNAADVHRLLRDLESCCLMTARQRLADFLIKQGRCHGTDDSDSVSVVLPASKALIASSLNISPETLSRELHDLSSRGLLQIERRTIRIQSLNRLSQFLHDESGVTKATASRAAG